MTGVAVLLIGPPGAGKTSVLERLTTSLERLGVEFGALESEQLGWGSPWLEPRLVHEQLCAVLELQRRAGRRRFVVAATPETSAELAALAAATGAHRVVTVLLSAPAAVLAARLRAREPADWPGRRRLVRHARELARTMPDLTGVELRVETDGRNPADVARQVRDGLLALGVLGEPDG